jgi:hypothetical protein
MQTIDSVDLHCRQCGAYGTASGDYIEWMLCNPCAVCGGRIVRAGAQSTIADWRPETFRDFRDSIGREN